MVDLRQNSHTYLNWEGIDLSANNHKMLYVPEGFALGFQTLEDNTEIFYQMSQYYNPDFTRGIRWNDKLINITWPLPPTAISKKDQSFELLKQN